MEDYSIHDCKPVTACIDKNSYIEEDKPTNNMATKLNYGGEANLVTNPLKYEGEQVNCLVPPCPSITNEVVESIPVEDGSTGVSESKTNYKVPNITILAPVIALIVGIYIAYKSGKKLAGKVLIVVLAMIIGGAVSRASFLSANRDKL